MKRNKRHIIYSWIVIISFVVGQGMIYAHQHLVKPAAYHTHQNTQHQQSVTEKCQLCDAMHHNSMLIAGHQYFVPGITADHFYTPGKYDFVGISLILSAGRSPPLS